MSERSEAAVVLRDRYQLTEQVGQGGMGSIYRAADLRLPGRFCAIKEVIPDSDSSTEVQAQAQAQFLQEASILAQLDHPNLPKVSDFFHENGRDYLVMDYVPGDDLRQVLYANGGPISEEIVLKWAEQIMDALAYLHRQDPPVLHRDIKPANIKLTPDQRIKLVDFGLVKVMEADDARTITVVQGRGTALYTPLEQYGGDGGHTDARTDIYALGGTLYHLLTDVPPPDAKARFLNPRALVAPREQNARISPHVEEAILWGMEMHPDRRPTTIADFRLVLLGMQPRPGAASGAAPSPLAAALVQNRVAMLLVLILLILALLITVI